MNVFAPKFLDVLKFVAKGYEEAKEEVKKIDIAASEALEKLNIDPSMFTSSGALGGTTKTFCTLRANFNQESRDKIRDQEDEISEGKRKIEALRKRMLPFLKLDPSERLDQRLTQPLPPQPPLQPPLQPPVPQSLSPQLLSPQPPLPVGSASSSQQLQRHREQVQRPQQLLQKENEKRSVVDSLFEAIEQGDSSKVKELFLRFKALGCCFVLNSSGESFFNVAARLDRKEITEFLLSNRYELSCFSGHNVDSPLHVALSSDHDETAKVFCKQLIDPVFLEHRNSQGETPLHLAVNAEKIEFVNLLLARKVNKNCQDKKGYSPLHLAASSNCLDILKLLLEDPKPNVNLPSKDRKTPLHFAASNGHLEVFAFLIEQGADENLKDHQGKTPFELVKKGKKEAFLRALKELESRETEAEKMDEETDREDGALEGQSSLGKRKERPEAHSSKGMGKKPKKKHGVLP